MGRISNRKQCPGIEYAASWRISRATNPVHAGEPMSAVHRDPDYALIAAMEAALGGDEDVRLEVRILNERGARCYGGKVGVAESYAIKAIPRRRRR